MKVHTGLAGIIMIVIGLLISAENHQGASVADALSGFLKLPIRNLVVLICMFMIIAGFIIMEYRGSALSCFCLSSVFQYFTRWSQNS
ncbi:hypothetical protein [Bacillus licheniformis]|uniref:hypothetical protein n=1 Tax=Bacillus licheniformis TaxID=1402 RepID=UPI000AD5BA41|nr:hypothetical protein [Bacillus licheniformis]